MLSENEHIGAYRIVRKIGSGGFGTVYLVQHEVSACFYALKAIPFADAGKEIAAFKIYQNLPLNDAIVSIIESGTHGDVFYYVMPLADSLNADFDVEPLDIRFTPKTLGTLLCEKSLQSSSKWFSSQEILDIIRPIFEAAIFVANNGLLHRDIKPDNILFIGGTPKLADFGLLQHDSRNLSNAGTPYFIAPNWYMSSGGNPDMWGLATTFYMLITGNYPDSMGRVAYNLPENSSEGFTAAEKAQWAHWHRCILRATAEKPSDRFIRLEDFLNAILATDFNSSLEYNQSNVGLNKTHKKLLSIICALCAFIGFIVYFIWHSSEKIISEKLSEDEQNIAVLKTIDPKFETVYREGLIIENATAVIDGLEVSIGRIELMSYNDWQEDYKKKQLDYQNKLARIRTASEAESSSREFQQLQRNVDADKFFYEYDTPPSFRKYQKYIDMTLNPQKYTF